MRVRSLASLVAGLAIALAAASGSRASEAVATGSVNIRAGAGVDQRRIATLPRGASMSIDYCRRGWCLGDAQGVRGWVSARYLSLEPEPQIETYQPPVIVAPTPPAVKFPFGMPDRGFHDYGFRREHEMQRRFK